MSKRTKSGNKLPIIEPNVVPLGIIGSSDKAKSLIDFLNKTFKVEVKVEGLLVYVEQKTETPHSAEVVEVLKQFVRATDRLDFLVAFEF